MHEEIQNSRTINKKEYDSGEAGMKDIYHNLNTLTSNRTSSPGIKDSESESFIPFSQQTSLTHAPALYEELIQKYEGDIRNHIRIEQQMKLHSDSVVSKLEDKEKEYDKIMQKLKEIKKKSEHSNIETKIIREENQALKKALEKKIEKVLNIERDLKEVSQKYESLKKEYVILNKALTDVAVTPKRNEENDDFNIQIGKSKFKSNSANPNSGRKTTSDSAQLFYSRNISGPNNYQNEEFLIPVTSNRSPQKSNSTSFNWKSIVLKKEGKSPYIQADLEKLK